MKRSPMPRGNAALRRSGFSRPDWPEAAIKAACWPLTPTRKRMKQAGHRLRKAASDDLRSWAVEVKERDGWVCQWIGCEFCHNVREKKLVTAHHIALRSARPDLRLVVENGVTVCWSRHNWIHADGRDDAIGRGFLNMETYEAAAKQRAND